MECKEFEFAWKMMVELRKEIIETQRTRVQVVGFKITFVSAGIGLIAAYMDSVPSYLFVIPAFAAIFFDLLVCSYGVSIKRIGYYCKKYLEPTFKMHLEEEQLPNNFLFWEDYMSQPEVKQKLSFVGNFGLTGLSVLVAVYVLITPFLLIPSFPLLFFLTLFVIYDIITFIMLQVTECVFEKKTEKKWYKWLWKLLF